MRMIARTACLAAVLLGLLLTAAMAESDWEHLYTKDGIDVYQKDLPDTDVCRFKGVGFVDASMETIGCVLRDIPAFPEWVANFKKAVVLKDIDRNTKITYNIIDTPFPYKNRDMIIENDTVYNLEKGSAEITFAARDSSLAPPTDKYVRMTDVSGRYFIEFFGREKTRVTYEYQADPEGNIPVALANRVEIKHQPYISLKGLREMADKQKYIAEGAASPEHDLIEKMRGNIKVVRSILKNRISEYVVDPELLDLIFSQPRMQEIIAAVHEKNASFQSIQQAVLGMFSIGVTSPKVAAYIADKDLADFFSIDKLMKEKWVADLIAREKSLIERFLDANSSAAEKMFHKITSSDKVVHTFVRDKELARTILTNAGVRRQLWADDTLRDNILNNIGSFDDIDDFAEIVEERVKTYPGVDR